MKWTFQELYRQRERLEPGLSAVAETAVFVISIYGRVWVWSLFNYQFEMDTEWTAKFMASTSFDTDLYHILVPVLGIDAEVALGMCLS